MDFLQFIQDNIEQNPSQIDPVSIARELDEQHEQDMDLAREQKILDDIAQCGSFFHQVSPSNGRTLSKYRVSCGYWRRGCPRCLRKRANEFEIRFLKCISDTTDEDGTEYLGIAQMDKKQAASIVKQMRDTGTLYWRVPVVNGNFLLFFDSFNFPNLDNPELHEVFNWMEICQTPKGSRYSGDLGRPEKKEKKGIAVKIPRFKLGDLDERIIDTAWSAAIKDTISYNPIYEVEDIQDALQGRMDSFEEYIIEMGGEVLDKYRVMVRVEEEGFGWKVDYDDNDYKISSTLDTKWSPPPPGFVKIDYDRLKSELWPV